jgi:hypothetical protein
MSENVELQAQGMFDLIKLADKELIEKILAISKTITVQQLENGVTRISIDLVNKN